MNTKLEIALYELIGSFDGSKFQWGTCDCSTIPLMWIDMIKGTEYCGCYYGLYNNEEEALIGLKAHGDIVGNVLKKINAYEVDKNFLHTGDIVRMKVDDKPWMFSGIYADGRVIGPNMEKILRIPLSFLKDIKCYRLF